MSFVQTPSEKIKWEGKSFPIVLIAENIHSPSNHGLIMRIGECMGIKTIYFTGPFANTSTYKFKKTARSSEKYIEIIEQEDTISLIQSLKAQQYQILALEICENSKALNAFEWMNERPIAILIGSERHGVNASSLKLVDEAIHIKQYGRHGSMNVGMALSIALYELTRQMEMKTKDD